MKRNHHSPKQIIRKLSSADQLLNQVRASPSSAEAWRFQQPPECDAQPPLTIYAVHEDLVLQSTTKHPTGLLSRLLQHRYLWLHLQSGHADH
jgi:hypothetical protein